MARARFDAARQRCYRHRHAHGSSAAAQKMRPRSDAATDGDRLGARDLRRGPDQTQVQPSRALLRAGDIRIYPQAGRR